MAVRIEQDGGATPHYCHFNTGYNNLILNRPYTVFIYIEPKVGGNPGSSGDSVFSNQRVPFTQSLAGQFWYDRLGTYNGGSGGTPQGAYCRGYAFGTQGTAESDLGTITPGSWQNICAVFTSDDSRSIYVNGIFIETDTVNTNSNFPRGQIIGAAYINTSETFTRQPYEGCIAHLCIWNTDLTPEQIAIVGAGAHPTTVATNNIVLYAPFDDEPTATLAYSYTSGSPELLDYFVFYPGGGSSAISSCDGPVIDEDPECIFVLNGTFSLLRDTNFVDWATEAEVTNECVADRDPADFTSYMHTFYHIQDDTMLWMYSPYLYSYMDNTSRNELDPSLLVTPVWEWAETSTNSKFARQMQLYAPKDNQTVSNTKNRVRGSGRSMQLQYTSEAGRDWHLLGWGLFVDKNARY